MIVKRVHSDPTERSLTFVHTQDVEPILEDNKRLQSEPQKSDWGRHVARVPEIEVLKWLHEDWNRGNTSLRYLGGKEFDEWFAKKIKDPDNKAWRVDNPSNPFFIGYR